MLWLPSDGVKAWATMPGSLTLLLKALITSCHILFFSSPLLSSGLQVSFEWGAYMSLGVRAIATKTMTVPGIDTSILIYWVLLQCKGGLCFLREKTPSLMLMDRSKLAGKLGLLEDSASARDPLKLHKSHDPWEYISLTFITRYTHPDKRYHIPHSLIHPTVRLFLHVLWLECVVGTRVDEAGMPLPSQSSGHIKPVHG